MERPAGVAQLERASYTPTVRTRVLQRVDAAAASPITLIVAPAGYGKSIALAQWLQTWPHAHARFNVQGEHNTLLGFARGLAEALSPALPALRNTVSSAYQSSASSPVPGADMARWMASHLEAFDGLVAIDDFHRAGDDPEVSRFVAALVARTKSHTRWLIATRSTLDLPVASWLAYRDADFVIGDRDLTFSEEETRALSQSVGSGVSDDALVEILKATSGWPVALAFALRGSTFAVKSASATREVLFQYLAEQVYADLSGEERALLHFASYLPAIDVAVLEAAGYLNCARTLEAIRKRASFLSVDDPGVYRCHDLFRNFLRQQLGLADSAQVQKLRLEAAAALERVGDVASALRLYAETHANDDTIRLLHEHGFDLIDHSHGDVVEAAIGVLPQDVRVTDATVLGLRAQREADAGRYDRAEALFERAIKRSAFAELAAALSVRLAIILRNQGRSIAAILEPFSPEAPTKDLSAEIAGLLAIEYALSGQRDEAMSAIDRAEALNRDVESESVSAKVNLRIAVAGMNIGLPARRVRVAATAATELAQKCGLLSIASRAYTVLASTSLFLDDDLHGLIRFAKLARSSALQTGDRFNLQTALIQLADAEAQRGDARLLEELLTEIEQDTHSLSRNIALLNGFRATLLGWRSQLVEADQLMIKFAASGYGYYDFDRVTDIALHALYKLASGDGRAGLSLSNLALAEVESLSSLHAYSRRQHDVGLLLCAVTAMLAGHTARARQIVQRCAHASSGRASRVLCDVALALVEMVRTDYSEEKIASALQPLWSCELGGLAKTIGCCIGALRARQDSLPEVTLTQSELDVLRALDAGQIPKEIAAQTGRSVHTIRTLIQRAIEKLGCSGRQEALNALRGKGIL